MKPSILGLSLLALLFATFASHAVPEGDKPTRKDAPAKRDGDRRDEFLKQHPELRETLEKLKAMSPEERQAWLKEHPEAAEKIKLAMAGAEARGRKPGEAGSPGGGRDRFAEFAKAHPELKEAIEKLKGMSPEERQAWLKEHPEVAEKIEKAKATIRERADNLTPEQKEKLKAKLKERGENLTPEQKEKLREKMKERFEKMTPEEKAEFLKKHPELKEKLEGDKK